MLYRLLDEYRSHVGNPLKMIELQKAIESLSLETFTDASIAYRRFPALMGRLLQPDKIYAKDFILSRKGAKLTESDRCLLNAMDRYDLELLCLRAISDRKLGTQWKLGNEPLCTSISQKSRVIMSLSCCSRTECP